MRNVVLIASAVLLTGSAAVARLGPEDDLARAVAEVERLHAMRATLAGGIGSAANPDRGMFQAVAPRSARRGSGLERPTGGPCASSLTSTAIP